MMKNKVRVQYYRTFQDDFAQTADQGFALPDDYSWEDPAASGALSSAKSRLAYAVALAFGWVYAHAVLHVRFVGKEKLRAGRGRGGSPRGLMLFCNHTQPVGDPFLLGLAAFPTRAWAVVSPSNLGIPVLGRLLPRLGALPVPADPRKMRRLSAAVADRLGKGGCVAVFPEAHVWPYCTFIRPFPATSFSFAVDNAVPAFSMTATYQRRRLGSRPKATFYIDGPFWPDEGLPRPQRKESLCRQVRDAMEVRARLSTQAYVEYRSSSEGVSGI